MCACVYNYLKMSIEVDMNLFIELIQQYPHLYDTKDKNYKNNELKEKCWEAIAVQIEVPVDDCKRLWRNLRDRFNKEKRLHLDSDSSDSNWPYFSRMMFYAKYSMPRKTVVATSRFSLDRAGTSASESHIWGGLDLMSSELMSGAKEEDDFASTTTPSETQQSTSYETAKAWACDESESCPKKIKQERVQHEFEEIPMPVFSKVHVNHRNDVNETFGAYVVSRLKEMNPAIAKEKRKKMLLILEDDD